MQREGFAAVLGSTAMGLVKLGPKCSCNLVCGKMTATMVQGPGMDPFGAFFDVILRDMLGTIPGGEEFLASVLGMAGRGGAGFPSIESGDTMACPCACVGEPTL